MGLSIDNSVYSLPWGLAGHFQSIAGRGWGSGQGLKIGSVLYSLTYVTGLGINDRTPISVASCTRQLKTPRVYDLEVIVSPCLQRRDNVTDLNLVR